MRPLRSALMAMFVTACVLGLAACGSGSSAQPVNAGLASYSIKLDRTAVAAGKVTFTVSNATDTKHEFVVLRTDVPEDQIPVDSDGKANETGKASEIGEFAGPNATRRLTLNLSPGRYVVICNQPDHYRQGMHTTLLVGNPGSTGAGAGRSTTAGPSATQRPDTTPANRGGYGY